MAASNSSTTPSTKEEIKANSEFETGTVVTQNHVDNTPGIDTAAEAALVRKVDIWIIPPTIMLDLLSFLDRQLRLIKQFSLLTISRSEYRQRSPVPHRQRPQHDREPMSTSCLCPLRYIRFVRSAFQHDSQEASTFTLDVLYVSCRVSRKSEPMIQFLG